MLQIGDLVRVTEIHDGLSCDGAVIRVTYLNLADSYAEGQYIIQHPQYRNSQITFRKDLVEKL